MEADAANVAALSPPSIPHSSTAGAQPLRSARWGLAVPVSRPARGERRRVALRAHVPTRSSRSRGGPAPCCGSSLSSCRSGTERADDAGPGAGQTPVVLYTDACVTTTGGGARCSLAGEREVVDAGERGSVTRRNTAQSGSHLCLGTITQRVPAGRRQQRVGTARPAANRTMTRAAAVSAVRACVVVQFLVTVVLCVLCCACYAVLCYAMLC